MSAYLRFSHYAAIREPCGDISSVSGRAKLRRGLAQDAFVRWSLSRAADWEDERARAYPSPSPRASHRLVAAAPPRVSWDDVDEVPQAIEMRPLVISSAPGRRSVPVAAIALLAYVEEFTMTRSRRSPALRPAASGAAVAGTRGAEPADRSETARWQMPLIHRFGPGRERSIAREAPPPNAASPWQSSGPRGRESSKGRCDGPDGGCGSSCDTRGGACCACSRGARRALLPLLLVCLAHVGDVRACRWEPSLPSPRGRGAGAPVNRSRRSVSLLQHAPCRRRRDEIPDKRTGPARGADAGSGRVPTRAKPRRRCAWRGQDRGRLYRGLARTRDRRALRRRRMRFGAGERGDAMAAEITTLLRSLAPTSISASATPQPMPRHIDPPTAQAAEPRAAHRPDQ